MPEARPGRNLLRVGRFSVVGVLNTLVDVAVFITLVKLFAVPLVAANLFAFAVALANSYVLNRLWTFGDSAAPHDLVTLSRFLCCNVAGALLATAALSLLARHRPARPRRQGPLDLGQHGLELPHHATLGVPAAVLTGQRDRPRLPRSPRMLA